MRLEDGERSNNSSGLEASIKNLGPHVTYIHAAGASYNTSGYSVPHGPELPTDLFDFRLINKIEDQQKPTNEELE